MVLTEKTLCVDFVDFFRARRTRCEPTIAGDRFDASEWIAVSRSGRKNILDRLTGNFNNVNI